MINIQNKRDCCGCKACGDICPKKSITFTVDEEGFWYPEVDKTTCVDCHLCEKVCPILHHEGLNDENFQRPSTFILQHKNIAERFNSSSGALYPAIAQYCLENDYYVAGHIFNDDYSVRCYITNSVEDLDILRNSKYMQSDMQDIYATIKRLISEGKRVLFSGCPCQIAAIKTFLGNNADELLTVDFTCMGIDSPWAFQKYIESMERVYGSKLVFFKSKSKEIGWRDLTNKMIFENGKTYFGARTIDANLKATFLDILMRPSCFECKFKGLPRISDITIGDYWHERKADEIHIDDNTGTSYYLANSSKGLAFIENIRDHFRCESKDVETLFGGNPYMFKSLPEPTDIDRKEFYKSLKVRDFKEVVDELYDYVHRQSRIKLIIVSFLRAFKRYRFNPLRFMRFFYYNVLSSKIKVDLSSSMFLVWDSVKLDLAKGARIEVKGICTIGKNKGPRGIIRMGNDSILRMDTVETEGSDFSIEIDNNGELNIGFRSFIGKGVDIDVAKSIIIGDYSFLGGHSTVTDNNSMSIRSDENLLMVEPTVIGTHCMIGDYSVITRGSDVGDEVIIEPNSKVSGCVPPRVVISGCPAEIVKKNVLWKK